MTATTPTRARVARMANSATGESVDSARFSISRPITRDWAWGGSTGQGVRVCVIDSGVDPHHPTVGPLHGSLTVERTEDAGQTGFQFVNDELGDVAGHGTACAGIIRALAPDCEITSIRILGPKLGGDADILLAALEWAVSQRFHVINLSLSTKRPDFKERFHEIADSAYFAGVTIVASAHNSPVQSYPWQFASVISVGSHVEPDPERLEVNPRPPVEFFANGVEVEVAWPGGGTSTVSGNSFATPHVSGFCTRILGRHPALRTPELKHVLASIADNLI